MPDMKPMSFNSDMVCALLDGSKTVTRRIMKPQPEMEPCGMWHWKDCQWMDGGLGFPDSGIEDYAPYHPGDILYVREAWSFRECSDCYACMMPAVRYKGVFGCFEYKASRPDSKVIWHPSIHMPSEAARIFLRVTDVRAERLRPMGLDEFEAEGLNTIGGLFATTAAFADLWDSTIKKKSDLVRYGWESDPWVWVIEFEQISREEVLSLEGADKP